MWMRISVPGVPGEVAYLLPEDDQVQADAVAQAHALHGIPADRGPREAADPATPSVTYCETLPAPDPARGEPGWQGQRVEGEWWTAP